MAGTYDWYREWNSPRSEMSRLPAYYKRAKLTPAQRQEICFLRMEGHTPKDLAAQFGVTRNTIYSISPSERPWV